MGVRRRGRELALQMLYQHEIAGTDVDAMATSFEELAQAPPATRDFAMSLARGVIAKLPDLDSRLLDQADNWRIERMAAVDR
ncbi:MAG: hypothetical protein B7Z68_13315, partial [Acidobacteria bacterium 21-70-11]